MDKAHNNEMHGGSESEANATNSDSRERVLLLRVIIYVVGCKLISCLKVFVY